MAKKEKQNKKSDTEMTESVDSMLNNMDFTTPEKDKDVDESSDQEKIDSLSSTTEKDTDTEAEKGHIERTKPHREATIIYKDREEEEEEAEVRAKEKKEDIEARKSTIPTIEKEPEIEEVIQYEDANGNIVNEDGSAIVEEPPSEVEVLQQQIAALQASLNSTAMGVPIEQETTSTEPKPEPEPASTEQIQRQTIAPSPLTDEVMEEINNGNKDALAGYVAQAVEIARQKTLMEIGAIVGNHISVKNTFDNFFASPNNSDLLPVIDFVKSRLIKIEKDNPTLKLPELLEKTAVEVRSSMGMVNQQTEVETGTEVGSKVTRKIIRRKVSTGKNGGTAPGTRARRQVIEKQEPSNTLDDKLNEMALSDRE